VREREKEKRVMEAMQGGQMAMQAEGSAVGDTLMGQPSVMGVD
jgi:hypothetical protein